MSEPIFRAWDNKKKEWIKDFIIDMKGDIFVQSFFQLTSAYDNILDATLCRSTGLRDSKRTKEFPEGEMIFQGDITTNKFGDIYTVEWDSENSRFVLYNSERHYYMIYLQPECEIIGNIFENKKLLERKKNESIPGKL